MIVRDFLGQEIKIGDHAIIAHLNGNTKVRFRFIEITEISSDTVSFKFKSSGRKSRRLSNEIIVLTEEQLLMKQLCSNM